MERTPLGGMAKLLIAAIEKEGGPLEPDEKRGVLRLSHVGWGEKHVLDGVARNACRYYFNRETFPHTDTFVLTLEHRYSSTGSLEEDTLVDLGFGLAKEGRTGSTLWRIAEGYVNGFALKDIAWYTMTRRWGWLKRWTPELNAWRRS